MSRPRSRSPVRLCRSSSLYRRSSDRCYSASLSQEPAGFDPRSSADHRSPADPSRWGGGRTSQRQKLSEEYVREPRRRTRSPNHWRDPHSDSPKFSSPMEVGDRRGNFNPTPHLGYAERQRLSPKKRFHSPEGSSMWRPGPHGDLQRLQDGRTRSPPLRFSQRDAPASYESATPKMVPSPDWDRAHTRAGLGPMPDQACRKSPRHCSRLKEGSSEWLEACDVPRRDVADMEAFRFSVKFPGRSPYVERCTEESRFKCSPERRPDNLWGQHRRSTEWAPLIVEHDHGIANRRTRREPSGERRASNRDRDRVCDRNRTHSRHAREGALDRYERAGGQACQDMGRNTMRVEQAQGKRSPALSRGRHWEAPQAPSRTHYLPKFREQRELDSNGDVDFRRMEPVEPLKVGVSHKPTDGLEDQRDGKAMQKRKFWQGGSWPSGAAAAPKGKPQETLTIKVDMQRPAALNRPSCFSSDRQLSLDLINVGRQRLDFLPMLEHSGTSQETTTHSGTFAQEIITLVHQVKENYFKGESLTLNERFSSVSGSQAEEDNAQPSSPWTHRRIDLSQSEFKTQPTLRTVGHVQKRRRQVVDNPGDLRHDLERRRQERLEGVKITIPGGIFVQHSLLAQSVVSDDEDGDSSSAHNWSEEVESRETGRMEQKRPSFIQDGIGPQRRPSRLQNRRGQRRQQNWSSTSGQSTGW